jgi:hypothetical protein
MGFALYHTDTVVELAGDGDFLVGEEVVGNAEGGVVGTDLSYVGVLSRAELGVVVTGCCV